MAVQGLNPQSAPMFYYFVCWFSLANCCLHFFSDFITMKEIQPDFLKINSLLLLLSMFGQRAKSDLARSHELSV